MTGRWSTTVSSVPVAAASPESDEASRLFADAEGVLLILFTIAQGSGGSDCLLPRGYIQRDGSRPRHTGGLMTPI
jgi:hypothetical protein